MNAILKLMLKGSVVSAMALTMAAVGCSDSDKKTPGAGGDDGKGGSNPQAGETSKSGSSNGGDSGNVGGGGAKADGGATGDAGAKAEGGAKTEGGAAGESGATAASGAAGEGGTGGASDGVATAKFCNTLTSNDADTTYILQIGEGADAVKFTATTGQCVPADGVACTVVPTGPEVLVQLFAATSPTLAVDTATAEILDGERLLFFSDIDADGAIWNAASANEGVTCEELTYEDVP